MLIVTLHIIIEDGLLMFNGSMKPLQGFRTSSNLVGSTMKIYTNEEMATIKEVAMLASYHLIGVKDQRSMNRIVAQSILDHKKIYDEERDKIKDKELLSALDEYHEINKTSHCNQERLKDEKG